MSDVVICQAEDGNTALEVQLDHETVWLSLYQMAALFQRDKSVVSRHLRNVFQTGEPLPMGKSIRLIITISMPSYR